MRELERKKQIETGTPRARKVNDIADRLVAQAVRLRPEAAKWKWEVTLVDDPKIVNAFAMAGGKMAIYSGMWDKLKATDDEIAQVMGREIGHAIAGHIRERMSVAMGVGLATSVAAIALSALAAQLEPVYRAAKQGASAAVVDRGQPIIPARAPFLPGKEAMW